MRTDLSKVVIDKAVDNVRVTLVASRPGLIIGKKGQGIDQLRFDLNKLLNKNQAMVLIKISNLSIIKLKMVIYW